MSTIKEVFFPATTPSTLSSELVSGTQSGGLEPGPVVGITHSVGLGFGVKWGSLQGARLSLWTLHSPGLGGGDLSRHVRASLGTVHLPVAPLTPGWACFCGGPRVRTCLCPVS